MKAILCLLAALPLASAQDTRTVTEPTIPPVCATLEAKLSAQGATIAAADEDKLDTGASRKLSTPAVPGKPSS